MNRRQARIKALEFVSGTIFADIDTLALRYEGMSEEDLRKIEAALLQIAQTLWRQSARLWASEREKRGEPKEDT